jgi:hypothetical protein
MSIVPWLRDRLFRRLDAQDERARARGWTVTAGPRGSRTYRDSRWDQLAEIRAQAARNDMDAAEPIAVPAGHR